MEESKLCFIDDCMYYLERSLLSFLRNYNIKFEIIDTDYDEWNAIIYYSKVSINSKIFYFNFIESLNDEEEPCDLIYYNDTISYTGGIAIFEKIISILTPDLIIHELNEIDKEIKQIEESIDKHMFEIFTMTYLQSTAFKYTLPLDIVLKMF